MSNINVSKGSKSTKHSINSRQKTTINPPFAESVAAAAAVAEIPDASITITATEGENKTQVNTIPSRSRRLQCGVVNCVNGWVDEHGVYLLACTEYGKVYLIGGDL